MEKQVIIFEVLKFLSVVVFLVCFIVVYKKSTVISNCFINFLKENKIELEKKYHKKVLVKVLKNQFSLKPFNQDKMESYLKNEIFNSKEFKSNISVKSMYN
jgi:hypothetical protein